MTKVMNRETLATRLTDSCLLRGSFVLRSGQVSDFYFDKYQFEADADLLEAVATHLAQLIPTETEVLAGLETGGIPLAVALGFTTRLPMAYVRKQAKTYGTARLAEGAEIDGRRVLIVEDVITTGGQVAASVVELRKRGALVTDAICVIDRSAGVIPALAETGVELSALFTAAELNR